MSREVDQRVVELQFDNANFEKNTKKSMESIDRMTKKLQFKGAEKGLEQLDRAAQEVDFDQLSRSLDTLEAKFSTLNIVGTTALVNLTTKAMDAGERLVKSLSIDQVASGWNKYVEKTGNVQTIMNGTGKSIDQVNSYLNKLMWYSDETSFSFNEMTSAVSTAVSTGADLDKVLPMIMGIANATADAGKGGEAFAHSIRNLMQSYSTGYLQLQDWNSLALASTNSKTMVDSLIEAGKALGTLNAEGRTAKGTLVNASTFRDTLSEKWATKDVMEKGFSKYAEMTQAVYDAVQSGEYDTASEAIEALSGQYDAVSERAFKAAQQAKSFSEAIDATKDAVSSRWMDVFETLFGNKDEATETWTELSERLYDIFVPSIEALNDRLKEGLDNGWQQFRDKLGDSADAYSYILEKVALSTGVITEKEIEESGSFSEALQKNGVSAELLAKGLETAEKNANNLLEKSDKELNALGLDRETIRKQADDFSALNAAVASGKLNLKEYANAIGEVSGREHLIQSLWNAWDAIAKVMESVKGAFHKIFPAAESEQIYSFAERLDLMTKKLIISDKTAVKIQKVFEGVFSVLRVGKDILSGIASAVKQVLTLTRPLTDVFLDAAAGAGTFIMEASSALHPLEKISAWVTNFVNAVTPALYSFGSSLDKALLNFEKNAKNAFNSLDESKVKDFITGGLGVSFLASIKGFFDGIKSVTSSAGGIIGGIKESIESLGEAIDAWKQAKKAETLLTIAKSVALIAASLTVLSMIKSDKLGASMMALGTTFAGLIGVMYALTKLTSSVKSLKLVTLTTGMVTISAALLVLASALKVVSTIDTNKMLPSVLALGAVMAELTAVAYALSKDSGRFMKGSVGVIAFAAGIKILASAVNALGQLDTLSLFRGVAALGAVMTELAVFANVTSGTRFGVGKGSTFALLAASLLILQSAVAKFGDMDSDSVTQGLIAIGAALTEFVIALNLVKGSLGSAVSLTLMATALNLLVPAFKGFGNLSLTSIGTALLAIGGAFATLGVAAYLLSPVTPIIVALSLSLSALALSLGALLALNSASAFVGNLAASLSLLQSLNFQAFLNGIKAVAWMLVELIAGVFKGIGEVASSLVTSIAAIITAVCNAIVLAAPAIGNALYTLGTVIIDTIIKLIAYIWEKCKPALEDLWSKSAAWISTKFSALLDSINPMKCFGAFLDELKNGNSVMSGIYRLFFGAGENASKGLSSGILSSQKDAQSAISTVDNAVINTSKADYKEHSPSKVMAQIGQYVTLGLAEGVQDSSALKRAQSAMHVVAEAIHNVFTTFWKIHSPSQLAEEDATYIAEGIALGMKDPERRQEIRDEAYDMASSVKLGAEQALNEATAMVRTKMAELYAAYKRTNGFPTSSGSLLGTKYDAAKRDVANAIQNATPIPKNNGLKIPSDKTPLSNEDYENWLEKYLGELPDNVHPDAVIPSTGSKSKSSSKGKSLADTLADEYSKKLKANKYLKDALSKETALWDATSADTASNEELLAKRTETVGKTIELQTERVKIAQEQYDTLAAKVGKDNDKTKDAYATLLDEQTTLAKLNNTRRDDIWEDVLSRYENDSKTAKDEYELWASLYEDTASVSEQANRKMEQIDRKINAQARIVAAAEQEYTELKAEFGEQSQKTQEAYRKYLEEQKDQQDLINELEEAQLEQFDNQIARYEKEAKLIQNRQQMLAKIYNDGDLSGREEAYKSAVEQYGANSKEARAANLQGTMSSLIGMGTALSSMAASMKNLTEYQKSYDTLVAQGKGNSNAALNAMASLQSEQYELVGFAEDLASAMDMTDNGKKAMMQLGYTISKNWKPIQNGFNKVWSRVQQNFPETAKKLTNALQLAMSEGAAETAASFVQTLTAAMSGDYATAIVAGLNTVLNFLNTEFGKAVMQGLSALFGKAAMKLGTGGLLTRLFGKLLGTKSGTAQIAATTAQVAEAVTGTEALVTRTAQVAGSGGLLTRAVSGTRSLLKLTKGGLTKAVGTLTGKLTALAGSGGVLSAIGTALSAAGPVGLGVAALAAGGTLVVTNWQKVKQWFGSFASWLKSKLSSLWSGAKGLLSGAVGIGKNMLGGLWTGVKKVAGGVWNGVKGFFKGIVKGVKNLLGIHSPSTVFAEIGQYMMLGLSKGITGTAEGVSRSLEDASSGFVDIALDSARKLLEVAESDCTLQPVLEPVVDLSDVQAGKNWMDQNLTGGTMQYGFGLEQSNRMADLITRQEMARKEAFWKKDDPAEGEASNQDVVNAIGTLGGRIDGVANAVGRMRLSIDGKKFVGGIIYDVDEQLGHLSSRNRR